MSEDLIEDKFRALRHKPGLQELCKLRHNFIIWEDASSGLTKWGCVNCHYITSTDTKPLSFELKRRIREVIQTFDEWYESGHKVTNIQKEDPDMMQHLLMLETTQDSNMKDTG